MLTDFDTILATYSGELDTGLNLIECNDDSTLCRASSTACRAEIGSCRSCAASRGTTTFAFRLQRHARHFRLNVGLMLN